MSGAVEAAIGRQGSLVTGYRRRRISGRGPQRRGEASRRMVVGAGGGTGRAKGRRRDGGGYGEPASVPSTSTRVTGSLHRQPR